MNVRTGHFDLQDFTQERRDNTDENIEHMDFSRMSNLLPMIASKDKLKRYVSSFRREVQLLSPIFHLYKKESILRNV